MQNKKNMFLNFKFFERHTKLFLQKWFILKTNPTMVHVDMQSANFEFTKGEVYFYVFDAHIMYMFDQYKSWRFYIYIMSFKIKVVVFIYNGISASV